LAIERAATQSVKRHVCVSQSVAEFYRRRGFSAQKLVVIPNGVEVDQWTNARPADLSQLGIPQGRRVLLYVGRLDKQKGLDRFLYELPLIFRELREHDLVVVGEGPQRAVLGNHTQRLGLHERIHFLGWQEDIPSIMAAADLLVLPSRWEGMPNVVLEAMAAGKPVVATQAEGTVELLGLAALEQTVPVGDWPGFRSRLMEIAKNQDFAQELGHQNQNRAAQFSVGCVVERYQRLYRAMLEKETEEKKFAAEK